MVIPQDFCFHSLRISVSTAMLIQPELTAFYGWYKAVTLGSPMTAMSEFFPLPLFYD